MKNKKAQAIDVSKGTLLEVIVIIASFVLILVFINTAFKGCTKDIEENLCHDTLVASEGIAEIIPGGQYAREWPATCKTIEKEIKTKSSKEGVAEEIGQLMATCWWMLGKSQAHPAGYTFTSLDSCYICYTVKFSNLEEKVDKTYINSYLKSAQCKGKVDRINTDANECKKDISYWNYIRGTETEEITVAWSTYPPVESAIEQDKHYAVVYADKDSSFLAAKIEGSVEDKVFLTEVNDKDIEDCETGAPGK